MAQAAARDTHYPHYGSRSTLPAKYCEDRGEPNNATVHAGAASVCLGRVDWRVDCNATRARPNTVAASRSRRACGM